MFVVETCAAVRRFLFMEGHSRREAARGFKLPRSFFSTSRTFWSAKRRQILPYQAL